MKQYLLAIIACIAQASFFCTMSAQPSTGAQLSEEERAMFDLIANLNESELEQLALTIEDEVGKMTPEEQESFWKEVDREAERLQPKIETYIKDQETELKTTAPPVEKPTESKKPAKPKPTTPKEKPVEPEKKRTLKNKLMEAETVILNTLHAINTYLATAQAIPEFEDELEDWDEDNKIKYWKSGLNWSFFKTQIEELIQKLNYLIEKDQNNTFKHLPVLIEDETLYNNIAQFERTVSKYISHIQEIAFELDELSPQSEQAMQGLTASLYEAINILHIVGGIDSVIAQYKPTAEQLKETEEALKEQARIEESLPLRPRPIVSAGLPEESTGFVTSPSYAAPLTTSATSTSGTKIGISTLPEATQPLSTTPSPPQQKKPTTTQEKKGDKAKAKPPVKKEEKTDKIADDYIKDLTRGLDLAVVNIEDGKLGTIKGHALSTSPYDSLIADLYLPESIRQVRKATEAARSLELRIKKHFKGSFKLKYQKALKDAIGLHRKILEKVANQIRSLRTSEANIPDDKAYAYLGGMRKERVPEVTQRVKSPSSLYMLEDRIRDLLRIVK